MNEIYFDNAATTKQTNEVTDVMGRTAGEFYGNPSSLHSLGYKAEKELKKFRKSFADILGSDENEIYFTSGGSESNNWALRGYLSANPKKGKHILVSAIEHPSVLECADYLKKNGYEVGFIPVKQNGTADTLWIENNIREDTALVSVMHVNSEVGVVEPVKLISDIVKSKNKNTVIHTDAVQSFGKIDTDVNRINTDIMSVSAHKIGGPRGIGLLYIRKGIKIDPIIFGGGQEKGLRSGTENTPAIAGFECAAINACGNIDKNYSLVRDIRNIILDGVKSYEKAVITTAIEVSSPYILNISFPGIKAEVLLHSLENRGIYVSVGSACSTHKKNRSHVLSAMGYTNQIIDGAIRFSFGFCNTKNEAEIALNILLEEVNKLYKTRQG